MVDGLNAAATAGPQSSTVDALSLHWYPASSHDKHDAREDMNATRLDKFSEVFRRFRKDIAPGWTGEVWAGETPESVCATLAEFFPDMGRRAVMTLHPTASQEDMAADPAEQ